MQQNEQPRKKSPEETHFARLPLELLIEHTLTQQAVSFIFEDPRIMPALGKLVERSTPGESSKIKVALAAFLLGVAVTEQAMLEGWFDAEPSTALDDGVEDLPHEDEPDSDQ